MRRILIAAALLAMPALGHAACYDLSKSEPKTLSGKLSDRIFAGPPNFEDVQKGDMPEPGYVLKLDESICLTGDPAADPENMFDEVQLVATEDTAEAMRKLNGRTVTVELSNPIPEETGHHHRPLVAWVAAISEAVDSARDEKDITEEYGTAATTIRAFYLALAVGNGDTASAYVVAEKRRKGPFSAKELSTFYGSLSEPIELLSLEAESENRYVVRYHYANKGKTCDGRATVNTVSRDDSYFIQSIKAHDGC